MVGTFKLDNGNLFTVQDEQSVYQWSPDSCQCIFIIDGTTDTLVTPVRRCKIHDVQALSALLTVVRIHNNNFNRKFGEGTETTDQQNAEMALDKANEKSRIFQIGPPDSFDENGDIIIP